MLWQRFLYDNLNLPDSWIFRPRITRITLNLSQFFRVNSRVSWAALPNKKQNSTPHLAPRSIKGRFALPALFRKTRAFFYLDLCRRILSQHSFIASRRQSSTRLSNVSICLSRFIPSRSSAIFRWESWCQRSASVGLTALNFSAAS